MPNLNWNARGKLFAIAIVSALVFFAIVFWDINFYAKIFLALLELAVSGIALQKTAGWQGWYGLILLRGRKGFGFMKWFGENQPGLSRSIVDYGLSLCLGWPFSYWLHKRDKKKILLHAVLQLGLALFISEGAKYYMPFWFVAPIVFLTGLLGFGYVTVAQQAFKILTIPKTPAGLVPVIPGVTIPLVEGIIAIGIVAAVHELAHGVMCVIEKLELKTSGIVLFGFLPIGAFVEPDEEKFKKIDIVKKRRILIAGSTSNFLFSLLFIGLLQASMMVGDYSTGGVKIVDVLENSSSFGVLESGEYVLSVNGQSVTSTGELGAILKKYSEGQAITLGTDKGLKTVTLGPGNRIGIAAENAPTPGLEWLFALSAFLSSVFGLTAFLNFALSVFNVLPVFITDGHRILLEELLYRFGKRKQALAKLVAKSIGVLTLLLLLINLLPWFK